MLRTGYARVRGYRVLATDDEVHQRLDQCLPCDELTLEGDCRVCGCDVVAKTNLTTEQCPLKKWRRIREKAVAVRR